MTMRSESRWIDPPECTVDPDVARGLGGHPLVARILAQRGYNSLDAARAFLDPACYRPAPAEDLPDLVPAGEHLQRAIHHRRPILVWGDFDVDGQTSTALLVEALRLLGASVDFYIPHRLRESHGIRIDSLKTQLERFPAALLITCDTGVSAHDAIDYAKSAGLTVLVTDHHDPPPELPPADAVVNPKRLPARHPLATLPGVGTAYKLVEYLYTHLGRASELDRFLDLVALGIVVDVAHQTGDTRYLLQRGLDRLRATQRLGLQTLIERAGLQASALSATDIAFQIGPRLNAAGRLDDARPVVELLTTSDPGRAQVLAAQLDGLNQARQLEGRQIYSAAQEQIERDPSLLDWEALILASPAWHPGLIGLVASQLAEFYQRPTVLFSLSEDGIARGSARSIPGYDIGAAIAAQADLLLHHGGHPGAAGLSLPVDHLPAFRRRLSDTLRAGYDPSVRPGLALDAYVTWNELSVDLAAELDRLAPFGEGNPPVTLAARDLTLSSATLIGRTREHRRLIVQDAAGTRRSVVWWKSADRSLPDSPFDLAFRLSISAYRNAPELQIELVDFRRAASAPVEIPAVQREVLDRRAAVDPLADLRALLAQYPGAQVWAEGYRRAESPGQPLDRLAPADTLIIFTTPPDPRALRAALERVEPVRTALLAVDPPIRTLGALQRRLLELSKYVINRAAGRVTLDDLTASTGHSLTTITHLLEWFDALGEVTVRWMPDSELELAVGPGVRQRDPEPHLAAARVAFEETAAYRAYVRRADPSHILGWTPES